MSIEIRPAEKKDLQSICRIYNHYVQTSTATFRTNPESLDERSRWFDEQIEAGLPTLVMEELGGDNASGEDKIIGFACLSPYQSRCTFTSTLELSIYMASASCHSGFGKQLMNRIMTAARDKGYHAIVVLVSAENDAAFAFAKKNGFEHVGRLKEVGRKFNRFLDLNILEKLL